MPMGPMPFGFAAFVVVKLGGYICAGAVLNKAYHRFTHPVLVGTTRTTIGLSTGLAYFAAWSLSG